jgi:hypothetical protein
MTRSTELMKQAEHLAKTPEIIRRVKLAEYPILYLTICQEVGFVDDGRIFQPGRSLFTGESARLKPLLDKFEKITLEEGVTRFSEANDDVLDRIARWHQVLGLDLRNTTVWNLDNTWRFKPDPQDVGMKEEWLAGKLDDSSWVQSRSDLDCGWEKQGFDGYTGFGWYRQKLTPPAELGKYKHVYLYFGGVDEEGEIFINGERAFDHTSKSTGMDPGSLWDLPFVFDAKPFLRFGGENTLAVRVHNNAAMGGIWRPVHIAATDKELTDIHMFTIAIKHANRGGI